MTGSDARGCPSEEQVVAWALRAAEPEDEAEVRRHLPTCPSCRALVRETEETLAALGGAVEPDEPPPDLRDRILDAAGRTPQARRAAANPPRPAAAGTDEGADAPRPRATSRPRGGSPSGGAGAGPGRDGRRRSVRGRIVAAAAAGLVAVAAITGLGVYSAEMKAERDVAAARAQGVVTGIQQLAEPGTTHAFLEPVDGGPVVAAVMTHGSERMVLPVALPANGDDRVYVLWGLRAEGTPTPLGTFDVRGDAAGVQSVGSSAGGTGYEQFAISIEPGRVAPATPTQVVASGRAEI
ncbi:anti-sigma factor domain-containing protein [Pseudonocardia sp. RS010]|uniref:anti-sigma factor domain-containing protein n=1 Tax=Pseudonocardia sp. RS010 TaxID=3385979 RepID=UPI00399F8279